MEMEMEMEFRKLTRETKDMSTMRGAEPLLGVRVYGLWLAGA
jgi:hypothetical protein